MTHILLCGFQGVGKSFYGRRAAERLERPFFDVDEEIEKLHGVPVRELYFRFGEKKFRDEEEKVVLQLIKEKPALIALGGGSLERSGKTISAAGLLIYLFRPYEELVENLKRRPLPAYLERLEDFQALFTARHALFQNWARRVLLLHQKSDEEIIEAICGK